MGGSTRPRDVVSRKFNRGKKSYLNEKLFPPVVKVVK